MQMDMGTHLLIPGVEHGQEAKLRAESMRVGGNGEQGFGNRSKQDVVEDSWVLDSE
jgi:2-keto-3-deoxy-L-rhamnonate aldolase RhmA